MAKGDLMSPEYRKFWRMDHEESKKLVMKGADPVTKIEIPEILHTAMGHTIPTGSVVYSTSGSYSENNSPIMSGSYIGPVMISSERQSFTLPNSGEKVFFEGCMWEGGPWEIRFDEKCSEMDGNKPCRHCFSKEIVTTCAWGGSVDSIWVCPRVVVAYNEGHYASTGVCLDCILEAAKTLEAK